MTENEKIDQFQQQLKESLVHLSTERRRLKLYYNTLFSIALISGVSATLLAGLATTTKGKIMLGKGPEGWQLTCGVIALLSLTGTVASSFQQNIWVKDRFWKIEDSCGILKSLLSEIEFDPSQYKIIRRDYHRLVQRHPDLLD